MAIILEKVEESKRAVLYRLLQYSLFECDSGHSIAEFMVLPKFRRNKIGKKAAFTCFDIYTGNWEVSPSYGSEQAYLFWKNVIDEYTEKSNQYEDGIFLFSNCDRERQ